MKYSKIFKATDRLGRTYLYRFLEVNKEKDTTGCAYIHLYNFTTLSYTSVEEEWFHQRKIESVMNEKGVLCIPIKEFCKLFEDLGKTYFVPGKTYYHKGEKYILTASNDSYCFVSKDGDKIYCSNIGTLHPYIANDNLGFSLCKWTEIRSDYIEGDVVFVDAWKTANQNEEGKVIAKINTATKKVEYLDEEAKTDAYAQEVIALMM